MASKAHVKRLCAISLNYIHLCSLVYPKSTRHSVSRNLPLILYIKQAQIFREKFYPALCNHRRRLTYIHHVKDVYIYPCSKCHRTTLLLLMETPYSSISDFTISLSTLSMIETMGRELRDQIFRFIDEERKPKEKRASYQYQASNIAPGMVFILSPSPTISCGTEGDVQPGSSRRGRGCPGHLPKPLPHLLPPLA